MHKYFTFKDVTSDEMGIGFRSADRNLIPGRRAKKYELPGRDGLLTYGDPEYNNKQITLSLCIVDKTRFKIHEVARWLSGKGRLIFSDEPTVLYNAQTVESVGLQHITGTFANECQIAFDCQPFAESLDYMQKNLNIKNKPTSIKLDNLGNVETCCVITIKNLGTTNITGINITRRGEAD